MLRTRTGAGTQVLQAGQTVPELQVVSLAGRDGFSRNANVHGFAFGSASGGQRTSTATQTRTTSAYRPTVSINRAQSVVAGGAPPGDPGGSKTTTAVEDDKKKQKEDKKARRKQGWADRRAARKQAYAEKRAARKRARGEKYVCFGRRGGSPPTSTGAGGGGGVPPRIIKTENQEPEKAEKHGVKRSKLSRFNPFSRGAPGPGDPDPGPGSGSMFLNKDGASRKVMRTGDEDENGGGGCSCFRVFSRKKDPVMA